MAPALVEDPLRIREPVTAKANVKESFNKEFVIGGQGYDKSSETQGTATQPAASYPDYLPVWDNEKGVK